MGAWRLWTKILLEGARRGQATVTAGRAWRRRIARTGRARRRRMRRRPRATARSAAGQPRSSTRANSSCRCRRACFPCATASARPRTCRRPSLRREPGGRRHLRQAMGAGPKRSMSVGIRAQRRERRKGERFLRLTLAKEARRRRPRLRRWRRAASARGLRRHGRRRRARRCRRRGHSRGGRRGRRGPASSARERCPHPRRMCGGAPPSAPAAIPTGSRGTR